MFTHEYSQPDQYHFSLDSILLAQKVAERAQIDERTRVLDLCAGCGVVGFDLGFHRPELLRLDFLEVQEVYRPHFEVNCERVRGHSKTQYTWHQLNYRDVIGREEWRGRFDLILSNPPYFAPGKGRLPPSDFKARCRFFLDSDFKTLVDAIEWMLAPSGEAYLLVREDENLKELESRTWVGESPLSFERLDDIRGTGFVCLKS